MIDCGYKCEGCKKPVDVEKSLSIFRFPKILVIHLKRFYHSYMRREKLNTTIKFPTTGLDLRKYAPNSSKFLSALTLYYRSLNEIARNLQFVWRVAPQWQLVRRALHRGGHEHE